MIDAHLHLQDCVGELSSQELLTQLHDLGVTALMVNGTSPEDWNEISELASSSATIVPSFGIHPWKVENVPANWEEQLSFLLNRFPEAGVGEIGLDKWISGYDLPLQRDFFTRQLSVARNLRRHVTIHCLQAWGSLYDCLRESSFSLPFLLHSYSGPGEMLKDWVDLGAFFSISPYFFRKDKSRKLEVFKAIPEHRLLLETDAPDMAFGEGEARYHGKGMKNHPANIELLYERYAEWSGKSAGEVVKLMERNFCQFRDTTSTKLPARE